MAAPFTILRPSREEGQAHISGDVSLATAAPTPTAPIERPVPLIPASDLPCEAFFDEILVSAISNPRYRPILLRADIEMECFVLDSSLTRLPVLPPVFPFLGNSFLRLLIHRLADTFCITRTFEQSGSGGGAGAMQVAGQSGAQSGFLVLNKSSDTRIPPVRLSVLANKFMPPISPLSSTPVAELATINSPEADLRDTSPSPAAPTVTRIMSRASSSDRLSRSGEASPSTPNDEASRRLTFQEREAAYQQARERIFRESQSTSPVLQRSENPYSPQNMTNAFDSLSINSSMRPMANPGAKKTARLSPSAPAFDPSFGASSRFDYYPTLDQQFGVYDSQALPNSYNHVPTLPPPPPGYEYPPFSTRTDPPPEPETLPRPGVPPWTNQTMYAPDGSVYAVPPSQQVMRFVYANHSPSTASSSSSRPSSSSASSPQINSALNKRSDSALWPPTLMSQPKGRPSSEMSSSSSTCSSRTAASSLSNRGSVNYGPGLPELKEMRSPEKRKQTRSASSVTSSSSRIDEDAGEQSAAPQPRHPLPAKPTWVRHTSASSNSSQPSPLSATAYATPKSNGSTIKNTAQQSRRVTSAQTPSAQGTIEEEVREPVLYSQDALPEIRRGLEGTPKQAEHKHVRPPRSL